MLLAAGRPADSAFDPALEQAGARINEIVRGLRNLITDLRPAQLDDFGLAAAIDALTARVRERGGVVVETEIDLDYENGRAQDRLSTQVETTVYRLVQEALTNAVKHAQAEALRVAITERSGTIELSVSDNGVGFDPIGANAGFGLIGMRERTTMARGELRVDSVPGRGTTIRARLPSGRAASAELSRRRSLVVCGNGRADRVSRALDAAGPCVGASQVAANAT